jgi:hypothetical protein
MTNGPDSDKGPYVADLLGDDAELAHFGGATVRISAINHLKPDDHTAPVALWGRGPKDPSLTLIAETQLSAVTARFLLAYQDRFDDLELRPAGGRPWLYSFLSSGKPFVDYGTFILDFSEIDDMDPSEQAVEIWGRARHGPIKLVFITEQNIDRINAASLQRVAEDGKFEKLKLRPTGTAKN